MTSFFALTTRGLEDISTQEIGGLPGVTITAVGYRRVLFEGTAPSVLRTLRTVDDVFIACAVWEHLSHTRAELEHLQQRSAALDLAAALPVVRQIRPLSDAPTFAISASFVGKRNYTTDEIKNRVAAGITQIYPKWRYSEDDGQSDLNLRLFIDHATAYVGLRLSARPQHERPYKQTHLPGSLKPQVAAVLCILAGVAPGVRVLDPFCGSGTILVEAHASGAIVSGGDADPAAVDAAQANAAAAHLDAADLRVWDAARLPLPDQSVDRVISNLPWGRQIAVGDYAALYTAAFTEMRRVVRPGGSVVLLTTLPDLLPTPAEQREISVFGQTPRVLIYRF